MANIKGVDISSANGTINFDQLKANVDYVLIRATGGTPGNGFSGLDPQYARNKSEARRVGLPRGYYHYSYPQINSPEAEADWFCSQVADLQRNEILFLDFEERNEPAWAKAFLDRLATHFNGYRALIYMDLAFAKGADWSAVVNENNGLFLAEWDFNINGSVPADGWKYTAMRQFTDKAQVGGVPTPVDEGVFYGSIDEFFKYGYQPPAPQNPDKYEIEIFNALFWGPNTDANGAQSEWDKLKALLDNAQANASLKKNGTVIATYDQKSVNDLVALLRGQVDQNLKKLSDMQVQLDQDKTVEAALTLEKQQAIDADTKDKTQLADDEKQIADLKAAASTNTTVPSETPQVTPIEVTASTDTPPVFSSGGNGSSVRQLPKVEPVKPMPIPTNVPLLKLDAQDGLKIIGQTIALLYKKLFYISQKQP